jgi:hypothetical protein
MRVGRGGRLQAGDGLEQRGLAGAVGAEDDDDLALWSTLSETPSSARWLP